MNTWNSLLIKALKNSKTLFTATQILVSISPCWPVNQWKLLLTLLGHFCPKRPLVLDTSILNNFFRKQTPTADSKIWELLNSKRRHHTAIRAEMVLHRWFYCGVESIKLGHWSKMDKIPEQSASWGKIMALKSIQIHYLYWFVIPSRQWIQALCVALYGTKCFRLFTWLLTYKYHHW